jgi:hypothetical protein
MARLDHRDPWTDVNGVSTLLTVTIVLVVVLAAAVGVRGWASRAAVRAVHQSGVRVNRFKLTRKAYIRDALLANAEVVAAVERHAGEHGTREDDTWRQVERYIDEIVPFFRRRLHSP